MKKITRILLIVAISMAYVGAFAQPTAAPTAPVIRPVSSVISIYGTDTYTPAVYTFDIGVDYLILPNVQLDAGANFGLTRASPNLDVYTGITARF